MDRAITVDQKNGTPKQLYSIDTFYHSFSLT